jgi:hypothetical protein
MDKEELKQFAKEVMDELNVSGGKISKFIQAIAPQYEFDKKKIMVQVRRALIGHHE